MATRFYLSSTATSPVTPGFAAWTRNTEGDRRKMSPVDGNSVMTSKTFWANQAAAADATCLNRQYISDPMSPGITFRIGDTVKLVLRCMESAANDNVNRCPICVKVYSEDGLTLRATLLALLHYGPNTTEWATSLSSKQAADGDAITAGWTTLAGDRLVVEIGGQVSSSGGTSVTGTQSFGEDGASDLLESEGVGTALNPWFEISCNITFTTTYSEIGRAQTVLVVGDRNEIATRVEPRGQAIPVVQGEAAAQSMIELREGPLVVMLGGDAYTLYSDVGLLQAILALHNRLDAATLLESRVQAIAAAHGKSDLMQMAETAKPETVLAVQAEVDGLLFIETDLAQVLSVLQGRLEQFTVEEVEKQIIVSFAQGRQDIMIMPELGKEEIALAITARQDAQNMIEVGEAQAILATQGYADSYRIEETEKEMVALTILGESDHLIPHGGGKPPYVGGFANENRFNHHGFK